MITTRIIPYATASATSQEMVVEITENVCRPYCVNGSVQPSASVAFSAGAVTLLNGAAIVPITATTTIVSPNASGCGCAHTQVFTETFNVAFEATTANTITLTAGDNILTTPTNVKCCKAKGCKVTATLAVVIA